MINDVQQHRPKMHINPADAKIINDQELRLNQLPAQLAVFLYPSSLLDWRALIASVGNNGLETLE